MKHLRGAETSGGGDDERASPGTPMDASVLCIYRHGGGTISTAASWIGTKLLKRSRGAEISREGTINEHPRVKTNQMFQCPDLSASWGDTIINEVSEIYYGKQRIAWPQSMSTINSPCLVTVQIWDGSAAAAGKSLYLKGGAETHRGGPRLYP